MHVTGNLMQGVVLAMITGALWGLVFLAPELTAGFNPLLLVAGRYLAYGLFALLLALPRLRALAPHLSARNLGTAFILAIFGNTLYYVLLANAITLAGVPIATMIIGFIPVTVAITGSFARDALPVRKFFLSIVLAVAAIGVIAFHSFASADEAMGRAPLVGLALAIAALFCWTVYAVGNSYALAHRPTISSSDWNLMLGVVTGVQGLALLPLALSLSPQTHSPEAWWWFIGICAGMAFFCSLVANALWNRVSRLLPLTLVGPMVIFETLFALLYGYFWESRLPDPAEWLAIGLMLASVLTSIQAHRTPRPKLAVAG